MTGIVEIVVTIVVGAVGSLLAVYVLNLIPAGRRLVQRIFGGSRQVSAVLAEGGITRMTLSRADYHKYRPGAGVLRDYLMLASRSIDIVSISLNVTQAEGSLISLFKEKLSENSSFHIRVTLLDPSCPIVHHLAKSLDISGEELKNEIEDTLRQLKMCKMELGNNAGRRLDVCVHDTLPIGSAILLDADPESGRIQVETKLYRAPRTESFGFEVVGPSPFYNRNYTAWQKVFDDSTPWPHS